MTQVPGRELQPAALCCTNELWCIADGSQVTSSQRGELPDEWQLPDTPEMKQALKEERGRGISWLLAATALAVWASGATLCLLHLRAAES